MAATATLSGKITKSARFIAPYIPCGVSSVLTSRGYRFREWTAHSKRNLLPSRYSFTVSEINQRRSNFSATVPVVLDPPNGSRTMSPSSGSSLMKNGFVARTSLLWLTPGPLSLLITVRAERRVADGVQVAPFLERDYPGGIRWYGAYPISNR